MIDRVRAALSARYDIERELGRGGMGVVLLGTDRELHREVAIKVLPPELASAQIRQRFYREARIAAGLSHPNLVPIFDVGARDDLVWFVMAYIDGESVAAKVAREGPQPVGVVRKVLSEAAQGLAYAHARGVVHRDIKPDNILLERDTGRAVITDFGISKGEDVTDDATLTAAGEIIGTARYMAPEQALGEPVDSRADIYSLGLVGWFMLTGDHAITGRSLPAVITAHVRGLEIRFDQIGRSLPPGLAPALQRCVAPAPEHRFERMEELVDALTHAGGAIAEAPPAVRGLLRDLSRTAAAAALFAAAVLLLGPARIEPLAWVLGLGVIGWMLLDALEHAARRGVTWAMIRRGIHAERARRREEGARQEVGPIASVFYVVVAALAGYFGISVVHGSAVPPGGANVDLYLSAGPAAMQWRFSRFALVAFLVALSIVVARRRGVRLPRGNSPRRIARDLMLIGWGAAVARIVVGHPSVEPQAAAQTAAGGESAGFSPLVLIVLAGVAVLVISLAAMLAAWLVDRVWVAVTRRWGRDETSHIPRWVDGAGSWIFDRLLHRRHTMPE